MTDRSCDSGSIFTVLLARRNASIRVVDVLRDWTALNVVAPVYVIDVERLQAREVFLPALVVRAGRARAVRLQDDIAETGDVQRIRICALGESTDRFDTVTLDEATQVEQTLLAAAPHASVTKVRLINVPVNAARPSGDLAWFGWHNVVIAPENSTAPGAAVSPIVYSPDDVTWRTHFVASLSSLLGLWTGATHCPFDEQPLPSDQMLVASRSFVRHLSASEVETELLGRLADVSDGYPIPQYDGKSTWVVEDSADAAKDMAAEVLNRHPEMRRRTRSLPASRPSTKVGLSRAIRMLFTFLRAALRNAPRRFLEAAVHDAAAKAAGLANRLVFGSHSSEYSVVVNGVRADGLPASWQEVDQALSKTTAKLQTGTQNTSANFSEFWQDFIAGGLTLLDAGSRSPDLPPRMVGANRAVIADTAMVAPDPHNAFVPEPTIAAYVNGGVVTAVDVLGARALRRKLSDLAQTQSHIASEIGQNQSRLEQWLSQLDASYAGQIGTAIGRELSEARAHVGQIVRAIDAAQAAASIPPEVENDQVTLSKKLRLYLAGLVIALLSAGALGWGPLTWVEATSVALLALLTWLVVSLVTFLSGQRRLFQMLHRRRSDTDQAAALSEHLASAVEDVRRLSRGYRQYLDWGTAFGRFVRTPLGSRPPASHQATMFGAGLPRNVRVGSVTPDDAALDDATHRLRRQLFTVGWAGTAWAAFLADVPVEIGADQHRIREDADLLWTDPGISTRSLLTDWAASVVRRPSAAGPTAQLTESVTKALESDDALTEQLLAKVESASGEGGTSRFERFSDFIGQLAAERDATRQNPFTKSIFAAVPHTPNPWDVERTSVTPSPRGLTRTLVVTQLSRVFPAYDLDLDSSAPPAPDPALDVQVNRPLH